MLGSFHHDLLHLRQHLFVKLTQAVEGGLFPQVLHQLKHHVLAHLAVIVVLGALDRLGHFTALRRLRPGSDPDRLHNRIGLEFSGSTVLLRSQRFIVFS